MHPTDYFGLMMGGPWGPGRRGRGPSAKHALIEAFSLQLAGTRSPNFGETPDQFAGSILASATALATTLHLEADKAEKADREFENVERQKENEQRKLENAERDRQYKAEERERTIETLKLEIEKLKKPKAPGKTELLETEIAELRKVIEEFKTKTPNVPVKPPKKPAAKTPKK